MTYQDRKNKHIRQGYDAALKDVLSRWDKWDNDTGMKRILRDLASEMGLPDPASTKDGKHLR